MPALLLNETFGKFEVLSFEESTNTSFFAPSLLTIRGPEVTEVLIVGAEAPEVAEAEVAEAFCAGSAALFK